MKPKATSTCRPFRRRRHRSADFHCLCYYGAFAAPRTLIARIFHSPAVSSPVPGPLLGGPKIAVLKPCALIRKIPRASRSLSKCNPTSGKTDSHVKIMSLSRSATITSKFSRTLNLPSLRGSQLTAKTTSISRPHRANHELGPAPPSFSPPEDRATELKVTVDRVNDL